MPVEINKNYKDLKDSITKAIENYSEITGELVFGVTVEIDEDEEYAQICPIIGHPEYTQEAKELLEE